MIWQCLIFQSGSGGKFEETSGTRYDTMVAERLCKKGKTDRKIMMASFYIIKDKCKDGLMLKKAKDISGICIVPLSVLILKLNTFRIQI